MLTPTGRHRSRRLEPSRADSRRCVGQVIGGEILATRCPRQGTNRGCSRIFSFRHRLAGPQSRHLPHPEGVQIPIFKTPLGPYTPFNTPRKLTVGVCGGLYLPCSRCVTHCRTHRCVRYRRSKFALSKLSYLREKFPD